MGEQEAENECSKVITEDLKKVIIAIEYQAEVCKLHLDDLEGRVFRYYGKDYVLNADKVALLYEIIELVEKTNKFHLLEEAQH